MRIDWLELHNFRGINGFRIHFPEPSTILFGINGMGKTSILEDLAIMCSWIYARLSSPSGTGRHFSEEMISNDEDGCHSTICVHLDEVARSWTLAKTRTGKERQLGSDLGDLTPVVSILQERLNSNQQIPLVVYYPVNRSVLDIPLRIRIRHKQDWQQGIEGALAGASVNFRIFFEWFRAREDIENQKARTQGQLAPEQEDPQLRAVRQSIYAFLPGYSNLRINRTPLQMIVSNTTTGQQLAVDQLSDGEKCLLALVGDLARRLALLNPEAPNPCEAHGVVMIDEIELHLHPEWQRTVISNLRAAFRNCQFILTTHSPTVLSEANDSLVYELYRARERKGEILFRPPTRYYGWDCNRILEEAMGIDERPVEMKKMLQEYFYLIDQGKLDNAKVLRDKLEASLGADEPELVKADVLIRRREIIGR